MQAVYCLFHIEQEGRIKSLHVTENDILAILKTDPSKAHGCDNTSIKMN